MYFDKAKEILRHYLENIVNQKNCT